MTDRQEQTKWWVDGMIARVNAHARETRFYGEVLLGPHDAPASIAFSEYIHEYKRRKGTLRI